MARKKRIWYPGATYHLMSRGNRRASIFQEHSDYLYFLECVQKVKETNRYIMFCERSVKKCSFFQGIIIRRN